MQDLSYSDMDRLRHLNAILLSELTMNYSDLDKMKYLNGILLIEFKNYIQKEQHTFEMTTQNDEDCEKSADSNIHYVPMSPDNP